MRASVSSDAAKDVSGVAELSAVDSNGEKGFTGSSERDFKLTNLTFDASFSVQQVNIMNEPYPSLMKESNYVRAPSLQTSRVMHVMPAASEHSGAQPVRSGSLSAMFGCPSVQLPMLDKVTRGVWFLVITHQQLNLSSAGSGPSNAAANAMRVISNNMSETKPYVGRPSKVTRLSLNQASLRNLKM